MQNKIDKSTVLYRMLLIVLVGLFTVLGVSVVKAQTPRFFDKAPAATQGQVSTPTSTAADMPSVSPTQDRPTSAAEMRAQLIPNTQSVLASQIMGQITSIDIQEGDKFTKGQALIQFDCTLLKAEQRKIEAQLVGARTKFKANKDLSELNSGSVVDLELSRSDMLQAQATLDSINKQVSECTVRAPFDGYVVKLFANPFETVPQGKELVMAIDSAKPKLEMIVSSKWMAKLKPGGKFVVAIDETGKKYSATIKTIGAKVDPVSQSINVYGMLDGDYPELKPGMSGSVEFQ